MTPKFALVSGLFLTLGLAGCAVNAHSDDTLQAAADGSDPTVCRNVQTTGTRFGTRVCKTESTWAAIDKEAEENASDIRGAYGRGTTNTLPSGGIGN